MKVIHRPDGCIIICVPLRPDIVEGPFEFRTGITYEFDFGANGLVITDQSTGKRLMKTDKV